jgi:hypothetical protein
MMKVSTLIKSEFAHQTGPFCAGSARTNHTLNEPPTLPKEAAKISNPEGLALVHRKALLPLIRIAIRSATTISISNGRCCQVKELVSHPQINRQREKSDQCQIATIIHGLRQRHHFTNVRS